MDQIPNKPVLLQKLFSLNKTIVLLRFDENTFGNVKFLCVMERNARWRMNYQVSQLFKLSRNQLRNYLKSSATTGKCFFSSLLHFQATDRVALLGACTLGEVAVCRRDLKALSNALKDVSDHACNIYCVFHTMRKWLYDFQFDVNHSLGL